MEISNEYTQELVVDDHVLRQIALEMALKYDEQNKGYSPKGIVETAEIFERFLKG